MSFWDRYLAPGDLRARQTTLDPPPPPSDAQQDASAETKKLQEATKPTSAPRIDSAGRERRKDALFFGGVVFTCLSLLVTRRSLQRKQLPYPKTFTPSNTPPPKSEGSLDAVEALSLATLNVFSLAMIAAGATMKIFDIADVEDLRESVRKGVGYDVYGGESEGDKEIEEWIASVLAKKDEKGGSGWDIKGSIAEKLKELEDMERKRKEGGEKR